MDSLKSATEDLPNEPIEIDTIPEVDILRTTSCVSSSPSSPILSVADIDPRLLAMRKAQLEEFEI